MSADFISASRSLLMSMSSSQPRRRCCGRLLLCRERLGQQHYGNADNSIFRPQQ
jgi:hypothetical protein